MELNRNLKLDHNNKNKNKNTFTIILRQSPKIALILAFVFLIGITPSTITLLKTSAFYFTSIQNYKDTNNNIDVSTFFNIVKYANAQSDVNTKAGVYPIDVKIFNYTYGDLSAKWWQWATSIPGDKNPLKDETGKNCAQGQSGNIWFLGGTFGGSAERTCMIPKGKAIMFPIYNTECSYIEYPNLKTDAELLSCTKDQTNKQTSLEASIDGVALDNLQKYRAQSLPFQLNLPKDNVFGLPAGLTKSVADGFWIIIKPPTDGKHEIKFGGSAVDFTSSNVMNFATEATYHITVG